MPEGQVPKGLIPPLPDKPYPSIWSVFDEISNARPDGFGISPITHEGIGWFCLLRRFSLTWFEVSVLLALDNVFRRVRTHDGSGEDNH